MDRKGRRSLSLFTPGPVDISGAAHEALVRPILHHRTGAFIEILSGLVADLKATFLTEDDTAVLSSSGTGAMEAVVANLLRPGDRVLVPVTGKFSRRWAEICRVYGIDVIVIDLEPGEAPSAEMIEASLKRQRDIKAVLLTHCETATGSLTDLETVSMAIRDTALTLGRRILTCADCISSLAVDELRKDEWAIDCAIAASQKGLLAPPGLAFVALNGEALRWIERVSAPRYYFDLRRYFADVSRCPFTPAVSLVQAVAASIKNLLRRGLENVWAANRAGTKAVRLLIEAAGFSPLAANQSSGVTAFWTGEVDPVRVAGILHEHHGIVVAQGQQELKGRILRVSAIGKSRRQILDFAEAFEATMTHMGLKHEIEAVRPRLKHILEDCRIWE